MSEILRINGMVDPHTHLRDLDWSHKATFYSETCAAVAGGYWAVFDMPNTPPATINRPAFEIKRAALTHQAVCDWGIYIGASQSDNTAAFADLWRDACGLKIFNNATTGDLLITDQALRARICAAWQSQSPRPIVVHAEDETVLDILALVRQFRHHTHFLHISTAYEINALRAAKAEGLPVSIGVCPHHLFLTHHYEQHLRGYGIMKPSLKTPADQDALWLALQDNLVDVIESDHAPHTRTEKESDNPPFGVPGLETTLPLMLTAVSEGRLTLDQLKPLVSGNVHRLWGLTPPSETYTLIEMDTHHTIQNSTMQTACGWTPFDGMPVVGKVVETWIRGKKVYDRGEVLMDAGFGQNLFQ